MQKTNQNYIQLIRKYSFSSSKTIQEQEENYINNSIKKDFKNSVAQWQCKKKISKLKQILQDKM